MTAILEQPPAPLSGAGPQVPSDLDRVAGRHDEAQATLDQLRALAAQRYVPAYSLAAIHAALGHNDEAFAWLDRAYDERDSWMDYIGLDPRLDPLRSDPRFATLLQRINVS